MNQKLLGLLVGLVGIQVIVYALFFMEVTVRDNIVNLHLLNTRQNFVIIGALLVLVGVLTVLLSPKRSVAKAEMRWPVWLPPSLLLPFIKSLPAAYGLALIGSYLFGPKAEASGSTAIAGLFLIGVAGWFSWRNVFLWLVPAGVWILYLGTDARPWSRTEYYVTVSILLVLGLPLWWKLLLPNTDRVSDPPQSTDFAAEDGGRREPVFNEDKDVGP